MRDLITDVGLVLAMLTFIAGCVASIADSDTQRNVEKIYLDLHP